jgi:peptidoglycan/LPS O-acetylase OafA/YrhL
MPVVRSGGQLPGGLGKFIHRRSMRILPPYFAAYVLHMLFYPFMAYLLLPAMGRPVDVLIAEQLRTGYAWDNILSHGFMIHNLSTAWVNGMSGIFWTIACEWQIYFLFAIVLVPLWRLAGLGAALLLAAIVSAAITTAQHQGFLFYHVSWMPFVFATGMLAATVVFSPHRIANHMRGWHWGFISLILGVATVMTIAALNKRVPPELMAVNPVPYYAYSLKVRWMPDVIGGACAAAFLIYLSLAHPGVPTRQTGVPSRTSTMVRRFLESPQMLFLGLFGYSLYLTHALFVIMVPRIVEQYIQGRTWRFILVMVGGTVASVAFAYVFYRLFERPFMAGETRRMFTTEGAEADRDGSQLRP